jgi:transposase-like protein
MPRTNPSLIDGLRENERMAAELLARGKTCREVSRALGISERALFNWRKRPAVQRAVYALQQELIDVSESKGLALMPDAIATLTQIMNDQEARAADRIAASRALLNGAAAYQERKLLERTVSDLESQIYGLLQIPSETVADDPTEGDDLDLLKSADPEENAE